VVATGLKASHNYLVTGYAIAQNTSAAAATCRIYVTTTAGNNVGPNVGAWITYEANLAANQVPATGYSHGTTGSFIYTPAVDGDVSFTIYSSGTAGAMSFGPNNCAIFVADLTGTQGPIGATGPVGPAGPAGGGSIIVSVRAYRSAAFTTSTTLTSFIFDTDSGTNFWDTQNAFNNGVFTCPVAGKYRVTCSYVMAVGTGYWVEAVIAKNGVQYAWNFSGPSGGASTYTTAAVTDTMDLAVGDTIGTMIQASGAFALLNDARGTFLTIDLIGGTGPQGATGPTGPAYAAGQMYSLVYYQTIPAPKVASNPYTVTHNLGTTFPMVQLWDALTLQLVNAQVQVVDANRVQISVAADMPNPVNVSIMGVAASPVPINPGDLATKAYVDAKTATLPAPVTSGTTIQSFTDVLGDVWVAKNGVNGGAWKRARDVVHCEYYRAAAHTFPTAWTAFSFDGLLSDAYGLYVAPLFTPPVAGLYDFTMVLTANPTATGQHVDISLYNTTTAGYLLALNQQSAQASWGVAPMLHAKRVLAATDVIQTRNLAAAALTGQTGGLSTLLAIAYLGTG
jgi:hypothetical protein